MASFTKLVYSSPFDDALSKPLIEQQDDDTTNISTNIITRNNTRNSNINNKNKNKTILKQGKQSAYAKLDPLSSTSSQHYSPPPALDEEQQETHQSLFYSQLTSTTPQPLGTHIESALLTERHAESQNISIQMRQILEINQDLATLVSSQQETIDVIEDNAYEVHDRAERGVGHLQRAKGLMKNAMNSEGVMRIFFLVVAVGGMFIALVLLLEALV
jgi:hypothetical protein